MKKNITVNLFGTLYAIDDDACKLLEQYLDNMRSYFSKREGGDEITDDIEHRVAELFSELKTNGVEAISIEHVRDIIQRIGNPEQMDESTATNESDAQQSTHATPPPAPDAATTSHKSSRKLYRDPQDQLLGGVMSGLCQYFGGTDPLPWRIIMVLLALFSFSTMGFIYLIAWAIIPAATTAEERLQMRGDPINPQTLNEELMRGVNRTNDYLRSPKVKNGARSFLRTLLNIIVFCLRLFVIFIVGAFIVATIVGIIAFIVASAEQPMNDNLASFIQFSPALFWYGLLALVSGLICLSILLYASLRMLLKSNNTKPLSSATAVTLIIIAVLSATSATVFGVLSGINLKIAKTEWRLKNQTINGIFMKNESRNKFWPSTVGTSRRLSTVTTTATFIAIMTTLKRTTTASSITLKRRTKIAPCHSQWNAPKISPQASTALKLSPPSKVLVSSSSIMTITSWFALATHRAMAILLL